ncbi:MULTISPECIES: hypothetical protein [Pseudoalteromonas]|uniref:Uncharacterized protein n=1 Tax=Pseudoalteromonas obscura TaxID=3048491 RepID=A0ABT7EP40_9GAMM|nr:MULTISPECIES: hypothetical protein [Pseudoalteromonas]MBQ4834881.1 hypothetical protein [Pseudoalteromonas luteoviolacea]MDK2596819.1 hypothetical protein [Pseudoalteromonas sp. P94(2023)]
MFKVIILTIVISLYSNFVSAKGQLSGSWSCSATTETELPAKIDSSFLLVVDKDETKFTRRGHIVVPTGINAIPKIELKTVEAGLLFVDGVNIKVVPNNVDLEVVKGKEIFGAAAVEDFKKHLLSEEVGVIINQAEDSFEFTVEEGRQTNHCVREVKI